MKSDSDIVKELIREQLSLKKTRYQLNLRIQSLYDRWKRNGIFIEERGTTFVPIEAVRPLTRLVSRLGKVERRIQSNKSLIKILTEIRRQTNDGSVHLQSEDNQCG